MPQIVSGAAMKIALATILLLSSTTALAGPRITGMLPYTPVAATYATGSTLNVLGDGSNARGGVAPALASQLANIATPSPSSWIDAGTYTSADGFCLLGDSVHGSVCTEPKMRTQFGPGQVLADDPVRNFSQPGTSHMHRFFGSFGANAYSTYSSLRNGAHSSAWGGDLNKNGYWVPAELLINPFADSKNYSIRPYIVYYYNAETSAQADELQKIPRGFNDVTGMPPDDPDDTRAKREVYLANLGAPGRYTYRYNGFLGIQCQNGSGGFAPAMKNADGSDGFTGIEPGNTCATGQMAFVLNSRNCWDGVNISSSDSTGQPGLDHTRMEIADSQSPTGLTCPNHWYKIPTRQIQIINYFTGFSDYGRVTLSSDAAYVAKLNSLPTCNLPSYSNAPCNEIGGVRTLGAASTFHADWDDGQDDTNFRTPFETNGFGENGGIKHQMDPGFISGTAFLKITGRPDNYVIDPITSHYTTDIANLDRIGTTHNGQPTTIHSNTVNSH